MIATTMAWLNDVKLGGGTAYMYANREMLVEPERGSMAFWFDLWTDQSLIRDSTHGGCPILMGNKWILNKWIYNFDQWHNYPCAIQKDTQYKPFTGKY